jgi:hypothetical protein
VTTCPHCSRANPADALFCWFDGSPLGDALVNDPLRRRFAVPFIFPSGRACWTFDELALAGQDDWAGSVELLRSGALAAFLGALGRPDLACAAQEAARFFECGADDRALDHFLGALPTAVLHAPILAGAPDEIDFGRVRVGQDVERELRLINEGMGLLHGTITSEVPWLVVGEGGGFSKLFSGLHEIVLPVRVRGLALRASLQVQVGRLTIASSGGRATITVKVEAPPQTFAAGVLAGARTPRQLAEKARLAPRESARLFETGAVARWYQDNGWTYPVDGSPAAGLAAVQQFFDALGLSAPPILELSEAAVTLAGKPGEPVVHSLTLGTSEKRPVYAQASSDQPWLVVTSIDLDGSNAHVHLSVPHIPDRPGERLEANLAITANSRQRFTVPVSLRVGAVPEPPAPLDWLPAAPPPRTIPRTPEPVRGKMPRRVWLGLAALALLVVLGVAGLIVARMAGSGKAPEREEIAAGPMLKVPEPVTNPQAAEKQPPAASEKARDRVGEQASPPIATPRTDDIRPRARGLGGPPPLAVPEFIHRGVEVVFCIDTTGSMGGLLSGAKQKIWAICNQIAGGKPTPELKVGLVAYRDKGDAYITKVYALSDDLDAIHGHLKTFQAAGGGDTPESVNQALDDAVNKIKWSTDKKTLRIIFLVGDAPPHMDYTDDVKYPVTCKKAVEKNIIINTIQCGTDPDCTKYWKDIAVKSEGSYAAIPQAGGVVAVATPFDVRLAKINTELADTGVVYGRRADRDAVKRRLDEAKALPKAEAAERAGFGGKSGRGAGYDLIEAIKDKKVDLKKIKDEDLPDELKKLKTTKEREEYLAKKAKKRGELNKEAVELDKKRSAYIAAELKKKGKGKDSFDNNVLDMLRKQAKKFDIAY